jgi:hypothetical protein
VERGTVEEERVWESGWEGHSAPQQRRLASLTLREKIDWLESAQRLVEHLARDRARRATGENRDEPTA